MTAIVASGRMRFAGAAGVPCEEFSAYALTPSGFYAPIASLQQPLIGNPLSDGVTYYFRAGLTGHPALVPTPGLICATHFPAQPPPAWYTRTNVPGMPNSTADFFSAGLTNTVRLLLVGDGTVDIRFGKSTFTSGNVGASIYVNRDNPNLGDNPAPVFSKQPLNDAYIDGESVVVVLQQAVSGVCINIIDIETRGFRFFGYGGAFWTAVFDSGEPEEVESYAMRGSAVIGGGT